MTLIHFWRWVRCRYQCRTHGRGGMSGYCFNHDGSTIYEGTHPCSI